MDTTSPNRAHLTVEVTRTSDRDAQLIAPNIGRANQHVVKVVFVQVTNLAERVAGGFSFSLTQDVRA